MNLDTSTLLAGIVFGSIGFSVFVYGKKQSEWKRMVIGIALMGYSYFIPGVILQWAMGAILILMLFIFR